MGGANSCAAEEAGAMAAELVITLLEKVRDNVGASAKNVLQMAMSSIKSMDEGVMRFISQCHKGILQDNFKILNAYYDASQKARDTALEVQRYAGFSTTELNGLKAVIRSYKRGTERARVLALEGLKEVKVENVDLPESLVTKLKEAMDAYENVIKICDLAVQDLTKKSQDVVIWMGKLLGTCAVIVLGVALCAVVPPVGGFVAAAGAAISVSISTMSVTAAALGVGAAGAVAGVGLTVMLAQRIGEFVDLATTIKEKQELLRRVERETESILHAIKPLKEKVRRMQLKLHAIAGQTSTAKDFEDMEEISGDDFVALLDAQLEELKSLDSTCNELCDMVDKAYNFFKEKSGFIKQRVLQDMHL